jgi:DNA (cytosine-5)-methyltransferase 1
MASMAAVLGVRKDAWETAEWAQAGKLTTTEQFLIEMIGLGEPHLVPTSPALRVLARLTSSGVDTANRLSSGKMLLGHFIGLDEQSPAVGAALHALGRATCTPTDPNCSECPINRFCSSARR